ncbi:MAG: hypothetical protein K9K66_09320 [Desulfarculaceae bacterium]|nr:hypothetical protein [Desulfarculaceae bacterium]MCF8073068.1 hypothetical protein [Desulfarculaceae bacterium]MCF8101847.1 hypothetical protein [Desulfarculaceae bacterium]MCF8115374.1 hypothetical protein [Desulfarculaceae bacterium]
MSKHDYSPGGRVAVWLYGIAIGLALFSGFGQMPLYNRYYLTSVPGLGWSGNFIALSELHYFAAALFMGLVAWRLALDTRAGGTWSWGPRSWWGWSLIALLVLSGGAKALRNAGVFLPPLALMLLDFVHLGSAMAFMFSGLVSLFRPRKKQYLRGGLA